VPSLRTQILMFFTVLVVSYGVLAQSSGVGSATLGMIFDPSVGGIRAAIGVPGAAIMLPRFEIGFNIDQAAVSPAQDYALARGSGDSTLRLIRLVQGTPSVSPLDAAASAPDRITLSPAGSSAALYYRSRNVVQVIHGLPGTPVLAHQVDTSVLPGPLTALAVSDDGQVVLAGVSDSNGGSIHSATADGGMQQIAQVQDATAAAFLKGSHDAWVVDRLQNTVFQWQGSGSGFVAVATGLQGISRPIAARSSGDGRRLIVASAGSRTVTTIDLATRQASSVSCDCELRGLWPLNGSAVFALTQPAKGVLWVFDGDALAPRIVFVPAVQETHHPRVSPEPVPPSRGNPR
jgi:hypothetical protein